MEQEIDATDEAIRNAVGFTPTLMRVPELAENDTIRQVAASRGKYIVSVDVDPQDWDGRPASSIINVIMSQVYPGAIIGLHDVMVGTRDALPQLLQQLQQAGYRSVTVSQINLPMCA